LKYFRWTKIESSLVNFGPQHPAAHGVLRVQLEVRGETIIDANPQIGLLHRATEKLVEQKSYLQALPYMDRLDYVSMMAQEIAFSTLVEKILNISMPERLLQVRTLLAEITRIMNHLLSITTHILDVGALTPFLWLFEEREILLGFYEKLSGARMHAAYILPGSLRKDIDTKILNEIYLFVNRFRHRINELEFLLQKNSIIRQRLANIGVISLLQARIWAFSGVMIRGSGLPLDLRLIKPWDWYQDSMGKIPVGFQNDSFTRLLLRLSELVKSSEIIVRSIQRLLSGQITDLYNPLSQVERKYSMEETSRQYQDLYSARVINTFLTYNSIESPKGEFGLLGYIAEQSQFSRIKIRAPGYNHLQPLAWLNRGLQLSDLVTNIGTMDLVLGEVDR